MLNDITSIDFTETLANYYDTLKKYKPISRVEENELMELAKKGDKRARDKIINSNLRFVFEIAKRYRGLGIPLCDLVAQGNVGLVKAMNKYQVVEGIRFLSYAVWWIKAEISIYINKTKCMTLIEDLGYNKTLTSNNIEGVVYDKEDEHVLLTKQDIHGGFEVRNDALGDEEVIDTVLSRLDNKERDIVVSYYGIGNGKKQTLHDIGKRYHVSAERIRQVKKKALAKVQEYAERANLSDEIS